MKTWKCKNKGDGNFLKLEKSVYVNKKNEIVDKSVFKHLKKESCQCTKCRLAFKYFLDDIRSGEAPLDEFERIGNNGQIYMLEYYIYPEDGHFEWFLTLTPEETKRGLNVMEYQELGEDDE